MSTCVFMPESISVCQKYVSLRVFSTSISNIRVCQKYVSTFRRQNLSTFRCQNLIHKYTPHIVSLLNRV